MRKSSPHFFKAFSRIGLTHKPVRQTEWNLGVEDAPNEILTPQFLSKFSSVETTEYRFTNPEDIKSNAYWQTLSSELKAFKDQINSNLKQNQKQIVLGGDNTVTFSSFLSLIERVGDTKKIGYIQFDSHGESSLAHQSISGNFHGMYMRPFFDNFDIPEIEDLVPNKLQQDQTLFIGNMILDGDEPEYFKKNNFKNITLEDFFNGQIKTQQEVRDFISNFDYIHINFDIDVFRKDVAGATGIPQDGKWGVDEVMVLLNIIFTHPKVSLDFSEVNPKREGAQKTIELAQKIISTFLDY